MRVHAKALLAEGARRPRYSGLARISILLIAFAIVCSATNVSVAQWPTIRVDSILPCGGTIGSTFEVTVRGTELEDLTGIEFTHPGIVAVQKKSEATEFVPERPINDTFVVTIAADVPPGIYEARVRGRFGISNPRRFEVTRLNEVMETGSNNQKTSAMPLDQNVIVNGRVNANAEEFYRVGINAGQKLVFECRAQSVDSQANIALKLYDSDGREIARSRDPRGGDPVLVYQADAAEEVIVGIRDFLFKGGDPYFYRLVAHDRPQIAYVWPPVVSSTDPDASVEVFGWNLPDGKPHAEAELFGFALESTTMSAGAIQVAADREFPIATPATFAFAQRQVEVVRDDQSSNRVALYQSDIDLFHSAEAADGTKVEIVSTPVEIVGRFDAGQDVDHFQFQATKDSVLWIEVWSQQLGCMTDPEILIQRVNRNEEGVESLAVIAAVDDPPNRNGSIGSDFDLSTDDPSYRFQVPDDGEYRVSIKNLFSGQEDARDFYRLRIRPEQQDFVAVARPVVARPPNNNQVVMSSLVLRRGETRFFEVDVLRRDAFAGAIQIEARGLPEGVSCAPLMLPGTQTRGPLMIYATADAPSADVEIEIVATAAIGDEQVEKTVPIGTVTWGTGNRTVDLPRFRLTESLRLNVLDFETNPIFVRDALPEDDPQRYDSEIGRVYRTSRGGRLELKIAVDRRNEFNTAFQLAQVGLPGQFGLQPIGIPENATEASIQLQANNNGLAAGFYRFYLQGDVQWSYQKNPDVITRAQAEQQRLNELLEQFNAQVSEKTTEVQQADQNLKEMMTLVEQSEATVRSLEAEVAGIQEQISQAETQGQQVQSQLESDPENETLKQQLADLQRRSTELNSQLQEKNGLLGNAKTAAQEASVNRDTADEQLKQRQQQLTDLQAKQATVQGLKTAADQHLNNVNNSHKPANITERMISLPFYIELVASPVELQGDNASQTAGQTIELPVVIERLFGFADVVEVVAQLPNGVSGANPMKLTLNPDQTEGLLQISTNENTPPGTYDVTLKATGRFNNIAFESTKPIQIEIKPAN